jgi:hypothetical protein
MIWWARMLVGACIGALLFGGAATVAAPNPGVGPTLIGVVMGLVIGAGFGLPTPRPGAP